VSVVLLAAARPTGEPRLAPWRRFARTPKGTVLLVLAPILLVAALGTGPRSVLPTVLWAVAAACFVDLVATWGATGSWQVPTGAMITGLIVAFVLSPDQSWSVAVVASALAVASKHVVRTRREHVFNPAAFGLVAVILLFGAAESWWGALAELPWPLFALVLAGGFVVAERTNKFPQVLAFLAAYFLSFTLVALVNPTAVAEMFRDPYAQSAVFLACFMLTDPPTSPARYGDQLWFGALAAVVSVAAQLSGLGEAYLLAGILVANAAVAVRRRLARRDHRPAEP
jgi:Na+-transporting NADH:ubiquinone oxidoreductase subunit NqrB